MNLVMALENEDILNSIWHLFTRGGQVCHDPGILTVPTRITYFRRKYFRTIQENHKFHKVNVYIFISSNNVWHYVLI